MWSCPATFAGVRARPVLPSPLWTSPRPGIVNSQNARYHRTQPAPLQAFQLLYPALHPARGNIRGSVGRCSRGWYGAGCPRALRRRQMEGKLWSASLPRWSRKPRRLLWIQRTLVNKTVHFPRETGQQARQTQSPLLVMRDQPQSVGVHCDGHTKIDRNLAPIDPGDLADQLNVLAFLHLRRAVHNRMWLTIGGNGNAYPVLRDTPTHLGPNGDLIANVERAFRHANECGSDQSPSQASANMRRIR